MLHKKLDELRWAYTKACWSAQSLCSRLRDCTSSGNQGACICSSVRRNMLFTRRERRLAKWLTAVYVPRAAETITDCTLHTETDSPPFIMCASNPCRLTKSLPMFEQYVKSATGGNNSLDLCYSNMRNVYKARTPPEHCWAPNEGVLKKAVKQWNSSCMGSFGGLLWFYWLAGSHSSCSCGGRHRCIDRVCGTYKDTMFCNGKRWITKELKSVINEKGTAFNLGNNNRTNKLKPP